MGKLLFFKIIQIIYLSVIIVIVSVRGTSVPVGFGVLVVADMLVWFFYPIFLPFCSQNWTKKKYFFFGFIHPKKC